MTQFRPALPGSPIPQTLGAVADEFALTRKWRLAMEKVVVPVQERETELRQYMIKHLEKTRDQGGDTGAAGRLFRVQITDKEVPKVNDWKKFQEYIAANDRFDLLQKRTSDKAILELYDSMGANEFIPGIETILVPDVSVTKV